ncbi:MAG: SCO family protein, partial [Gemmatimonadaceae bacterium]
TTSRIIALILTAVTLSACSKEPDWRGTVVEPARVIAPAIFTDSAGNDVSLIPSPGGAAFVFFGYTNCPDVCPTTLADWVRVKTALGGDAKRVRFVFVTIDPERDTPAIAQRYAAQFDATFVGLSTTPARTDSIENLFGAASSKEASTSAAGYLMGHSSQTFLMDDTGKLRVSYGFGAGWDVISADVKQLLRRTKQGTEPVAASNAYALPALKGGTGGAFMTITNAGAVPVRISGASSVDASAVELHESMQHNGTTHMQRLSTLDIAPGASTALAPGAKHFMLVALRRAFAVRDTMHLILRVENLPATSTADSGARDIAVAVPVRIP